MAADPFAAREQERDDAVRQLAMLRVTLNAWIERLTDELEEAAIYGTTERTTRRLGEGDGYRKVLSLLGPEEPDTYDPEAPF